MRSEARIREMQQSGPCAVSYAFLERSLVAMLAYRARLRQHAITPFCVQSSDFCERVHVTWMRFLTVQRLSGDGAAKAVLGGDGKRGVES